MRHILLQVVICLTLLGCKKEYSANTTATPGDLSGNWRMVSVKDNLRNVVTTKPASITGDVDITFTPASSTDGVITGVTPTNSLSAAYTTSANAALSIPSVARSKTAETSWGALFIDNITYANNYVYASADKLLINTSSNTTLTFDRR